MPTPLDPDELRLIDAYWRAANYLSVGQIYLLDNPLLREPLRPEHVKPRLLGHWGTTPGLNLIYAHLNRVIRAATSTRSTSSAPATAGPAIVANAWLEGTYSEVYPSITRDAEGMRRLFRQFSFPGGIPSHVAPETPGSIHEGGELGYALSHAFGAAFDNPDLLVCCVVGDGEAETGPLATSWHSNKFLEPGAATAPCCRSCTSTATRSRTRRSSPASRPTSSTRCWRATATGRTSSRATIRRTSTSSWPRRWTPPSPRSRAIQRAAREGGVTERPRWPMIVFRTPKGWTGPKMVDGHQVEGTWRAHQVPMGEVRTNADHRRSARDLDALVPARRAVRRATAPCARSSRRSPRPGRGA